MESKVKHIPSGAVYANRKEAKLMMGHNNYNRALHNRQMLFVSLYNPSDVII